MRKLIYSLAMSLDNKIARPDGSVEWLHDIPNPDKSDYGVNNFFNSVSTTIMGYNTYKVIQGFDVEWPYKEKDSYVYTRKTTCPDDPNVTFIHQNHYEFLSELKSATGGDIWLVGGGVLATHLFNEKMIDRFLLHIMPLILGEGIPFLLPDTKQTNLELISGESYSSGVVGLLYGVGD